MTPGGDGVPDSPEKKPDGPKTLTEIIPELNRRILPEGGFGRLPAAPFDAVSTAWALLALLASDSRHESLRSAADRLVALQQPDGRLSVDRRFPDTHWLTSLLVLITSALPGYEKAGQKAVDRLLTLSGAHWVKKAGDPNGHDTSIPGWGWASFSHSWVEPTALAIVSLRARGMGDHERVKQGIALLLDRQLASGGWNYGNISVFGKTLFPTPESTGHALCALEGAVPEQRVSTSLAYIAGEMQTLRTPLSLAWGLMALSAWQKRPAEAPEWIAQSLALQSRYGPYDTPLLAQLILAASAPKGLLALLGRKLS